MNTTENWAAYRYPIKKLWFSHRGGNRVGIYHIHAITLREPLAEDEAPLTPNYLEARLHHFSFMPDIGREDLHARNLDELPSRQIQTLLLSYAEMMLGNPKDWIRGTKKTYMYYPNFGKFFIRQNPCLVLPAYRHLFDLDRTNFEAEVDDEHPFIQSFLAIQKRA